MDPENFMTWKAPCLVCGKNVSEATGIFCGNFLRKRGRYLPCLAVWCGDKCLRQRPDDPFPVQRTLDEEDAEEEDLEVDEGLSDRFQFGRSGDHLMGIPFECDLCHFRNLNRRDPDQGDAKDDWTLLCIRRAILDAFWSRESSTVRSNLNRLKLDYQSAMGTFSMACPLPALGSDEVEDKVGMGGALIMLNASLQQGKNVGSHL